MPGRVLPLTSATPPALAWLRHVGASKAIVVSTRSDIFRGETSLLGDPRQHPWSDLFIVMECENDVLPPWSRKGTVRTGLSLDRPPDSLKDREQPSRLD